MNKTESPGIRIALTTRTTTEKLMARLTTQKDSRSEPCYECGNPVEIMGAYAPQISDIKCPICRGKSTQRDAEMRADALDKLLSLVPDSFRDTDPSKLPAPDRLSECLKWTYGGKGLILVGPTRRGKSRVLWELAKREIKTGRSIHAVTAFELLRYPALFMAGDDASGKFSEKLVKVDLLMLDDVFKAKLTERVEELLFAVIEERASWNKPCLITLNDTGDTLAARMSTDRGPALIARMREFCSTVSFV